jgi:hypothetical protein
MSRVLSSLALCALALPGTALAGDVQEAFKQFSVPKYDAAFLSVQGEDLLNVTGSGGEVGDVNMHLGSTYIRTRQEKTLSWGIVNQADLRYASVAGGDGAASLQEHAFGDARKYMNGRPRGQFIEGGAGVDLGNANDSTTTGLGAFVGTGYGRVVDARGVAQAAAICKALDKDCTPEQMVDVAHIIAKAPIYFVKHKLEFQREFYADIAKALGGGVGAEGIFKAQQVLESPLYNIGQRRVGNEFGVRAGFAGDNLHDGDVSANAAFLQQYAGWSKMLDARTNVLVTESFEYGLKNDGVSQFQFLPLYSGLVGTSVAPVAEGVALVRVRGEVFRNFGPSWQAYGGLELNQQLAPGANTGFALNAGTDVTLGNKLVASAGLAAGDSSLSAEGGLDWNLYGRFRYFVF